LALISITAIGHCIVKTKELSQVPFRADYTPLIIAFIWSQHILLDHCADGDMVFIKRGHLISTVNIAHIGDQKEQCNPPLALSIPGI